MPKTKPKFKRMLKENFELRIPNRDWHPKPKKFEDSLKKSILTQFFNEAKNLNYRIRGDERFEIDFTPGRFHRTFSATFSHKAPLVADIKISVSRGETISDVQRSIRAELSHFVHGLKALQSGRILPNIRFFRKESEMKKFMKELPKDLSNIQPPKNPEIGGLYAITEAIDELSHFTPEKVKERAKKYKILLEKWRRGDDEQIRRLTDLMMRHQDTTGLDRFPMHNLGFLSMEALGSHAGHTTSELITSAVCKKIVDWGIKEKQIVPTIHKFRTLLASFDFARPELENKTIRDYISFQRLALSSIFKGRLDPEKETRDNFLILKREIDNLLKRSPEFEHQLLKDFSEKVDLSKDGKTEELSPSEKELVGLQSQLYDYSVSKLDGVKNKLSYEDDRDMTTFFIRQKLLGLSNLKELDNAIKHLEAGGGVRDLIATEGPLPEEEITRLEAERKKETDEAIRKYEEVKVFYERPKDVKDLVKNSLQALSSEDPQTRFKFVVGLAKIDPARIGEGFVDGITKKLINLLSDDRKMAFHLPVTPAFIEEEKMGATIANWAHQALWNLGNWSPHKEKVINLLIENLKSKDKTKSPDSRALTISALQDIRSRLMPSFRDNLDTWFEFQIEKYLKDKEDDFRLVKKINSSFELMKKDKKVGSFAEQSLDSFKNNLPEKLKGTFSETKAREAPRKSR